MSGQQKPQNGTSDGLSSSERSPAVLELCCDSMRVLGEFTYAHILRRAKNRGRPWRYQEVVRTIRYLADHGAVEIRRESTVNNETDWSVTPKGWHMAGRQAPLALAA